MNENHFRAVLMDLVDENPFAIRAVLKILAVEFTPAVRTLAVTCDERPRLLVNLDFVRAHCATEAEVKAVICHEFLHILLRHTEQRGRPTWARNLATDAVINAIIHRQYGAAYSSFMSRYYADSADLLKLLRPLTDAERNELFPWGWAPTHLPTWQHAWHALYEGKLVADDIEDLARSFPGASSTATIFLGNHDDLGRPLPAPLAGALRQALKTMNGSGIWRSPHGRGAGAAAAEVAFHARHDGIRRWRRLTLAILRRHLSPDPRSRLQRDDPTSYLLPVLSPQDRRAYLRSQWTPFLPEARWDGRRRRRDGSAHVYLDASGSMYAEMPQIVALLAQVGPAIRRPLWAFSDTVAPAVIEGGRLEASTTGGTSMSCVLEHIAATRPPCAVVVTDGYIEPLDPQLVAGIRNTRLHALVTRDGSTAALDRAGIACTQLPQLEEEQPC